MATDTLRLAMSVALIALFTARVSADALLRAWAESGNEYPVQLAVQVPRGGLPSATIRTVTFTVTNPQPRRSIQLQAVVVYSTYRESMVTVGSNVVTLEIDETARDCRLYFFIINGYALAGSLSIGGRKCDLNQNSSGFVLFLGDLPAGTTLKGKVSIFAR